jgi:pimeloyl-ACP methyl ester carboxylesterase
MTTAREVGKRRLQLGAARVAYYDEGSGPPVLLLHGCPFSSLVWRQVIPLLRPQFRCLAPDLLGLGDTETPPGADWSLPAQVTTVIELLDALDIDAAHVVGHDHGGALAQLLAADHPERVRRLVLMNAEAYDNWPSRAELPFVRLTQMPVLGRLALWAWSRPAVFKLTLNEAHAVHDRSALTPELVRGYIGANFGEAHRRARTRRFLAHQLDPSNNRRTLDLLPKLRSFDHPTLLLWARDDPHFGPEWAERLQRDIPGSQELQLLPDTGHLLMEERPVEVASRIAAFLA